MNTDGWSSRDWLIAILLAVIVTIIALHSTGPVPGDPGCENGYWLRNGSKLDTPDWVCP